MSVSRRKFLIGSAATMGALGAVPGFKYVSRASGGHGSDHSAGPGEMHYVSSTCGMCVNKCAFKAQIVDGVINRLERHPGFVKSRGMLCARGNAGAQQPYSADRLKTPLIRVGERGEGKWKKASWEEAMDFIQKKVNAAVEKSGGNRSSIAFASTEGPYQEHYFLQFAEIFGSYNTVRHPTTCLTSVIQGFSSVFGTYPSVDVKNCNYLIMSGANRAESFLTPDTIDAFDKTNKGRTLIYLDPRYTKTAAKADMWLPIKPATDLAFALAMLNVIIGEGLYDQNFVNQHTVGFNQLKRHVRQYTPEWAEQETEIAADTIRTIARDFANAAPRAAYYPGRRTSWYKDDVATRRAMAMVNAVCGCWDTKGGIVPNSGVPLGKHDYMAPWYDGSRERLEKRDVAFLSERDGSWVAWRERALKSDPYAIHGLFVYKQNILNTVPDQQKSIDLFNKLDIVTVIDVTMSDTAWYADVVLPEETYLERLDPPESLGGIQPVAVIRQPVIKPLHDTKPCYEIMKMMASRFTDPDGTSLDEYFEGTVAEHIEHAMHEHGHHALEKLYEDGFFMVSDKPQIGKVRSTGARLKTKSGKIELYSQNYADKGLDAMPVWKRPEQPEQGKYRMLVGRHAIFTHGTTANNEYLNWHMPENTIWINTAEAKKLGISKGDTVRVKSSAGEQTIKAEPTAAIRPDCVYFTHGFGSVSPAQANVYKVGANDAVILESRFENVSGNACLHETFVEIQKV